MKVIQNNAPLDTARSVENAKSPDIRADVRKGKLAENTAGTTAGGSTVEISERARLMQQAADAARMPPDINRERVAELKKSIAQGTYRVDSGAVAERLLEEHLNADFGKNNL